MGLPGGGLYTLGLSRNEQYVQGHCLKGLGVIKKQV